MLWIVNICVDISTWIWQILVMKLHADIKHENNINKKQKHIIQFMQIVVVGSCLQNI